MVQRKINIKDDEDRDFIVDPTDCCNEVYRIKRHRFVHDSAPDFHRLLITFGTPDGETYPFALVQYRFDGEPHAVVNKPHGNSKNSLPFIPTKKSTLEKLTSVVKEHSSTEEGSVKVDPSTGSQVVTLFMEVKSATGSQVERMAVAISAGGDGS